MALESDVSLLRNLIRMIYSGNFNFGEDTINEMVVQLGTYQVSFDVSLSEATIIMEAMWRASHIEANWLQLMTSMINKMPGSPLAPSAIMIAVHGMASPKMETVFLLSERYQLSPERAAAPDIDITVERNICVVMGCLAEKLGGVQITQLFTLKVRDYLFQHLMNRNDGFLVLYSMIALEKFAAAETNLNIIKQRIEQEGNPLLGLEEHVNSVDPIWRQVGFCARWALDNTFPVTGRQLSYESVNMSQINVMMNDSSYNFVRFSPDGLEVRYDRMHHETLRATHEVEQGVWFYEVTLVTAGAMRIGWAATGGNMEGVVGNNAFSVGYAGNKQCIWYNYKPYPIKYRRWLPGDIVGCLLDISKKTITFMLNGAMEPFTDFSFIGELNMGHKYVAAATLQPLQQCIFNFGHRPFNFPPSGIEFSTLNQFGQLSTEQKMIKTRRLIRDQDLEFNAGDDACKICFDRTAAVTLQPCGHDTFCGQCASQLIKCPICRADVNTRH